MKKLILNILLVCLLFLLLISLYHVLSGRIHESANIGKVTQVLTQEQVLHSKLEKEYKYYISSEYIQTVSHDDLGLAPKGEYIVVLPTGGQMKSSPVLKERTSQKTFNIELWLQLLIN